MPYSEAPQAKKEMFPSHSYGEISKSAVSSVETEHDLSPQHPNPPFSEGGSRSLNYLNILSQIHPRIELQFVVQITNET